MSGRRKLRVAGGVVLSLVLISFVVWLSQSGETFSSIAGGLFGSDEGGGGTGGEGGPLADDGHGQGLAFDGGVGGWRPATPLSLPTAIVTEDPSTLHGALTGHVVSQRDGHAVAGAELVFESDGTTTSVRSRSDGTFALNVSASGTFVLAIASAPGFLPFAPEWGHSPIAFNARPAQRIDGVVVHLVPETRYTVEVLDESDRPVPGATVRLIGAGAGERAMAPVQESFTTDDEGRARVSAWSGAMLEAEHREHGRGRARIGTATDVQIELHGSSPTDRETGSIGGIVRTGRGAPLEGAIVQAWAMQRGLHPSRQGTADEEGQFQIDGLDSGAHVLVASHPEHPGARVAGVITGTTDVEIELAGGQSVEGRVVDEDGAPVPAFTIVARRAAGTLRRRTVATVSTYDADGRFIVTGLEEGRYELVATSRGYPPSVGVDVQVGSAPEITITLHRGGRLEGVVTSAADGSPIAGAAVSLEGRLGQGSSAVPVLAHSVSDEEGRYALDGVGDILRSVRVSADSHHSRILAGFRIAPGDTREMNVELTPIEEGEESRLELVGVGVTLHPAGETVRIGRVVPGGGAEAAGLQRGDRIIRVDGVGVTELGFGGTLDHIRGPEGTTVRLGILRAGEEFEVAIARRRVRT